MTITSRNSESSGEMHRYWMAGTERRREKIKAEKVIKRTGIEPQMIGP